MKNSHIDLWMLRICILSLFMTSSSHADVFKWIDANGQTHYSENKEEAGKARAEQLNIQSQPTSPQEANSATQYLREQERSSKNVMDSGRRDVVTAQPRPQPPSLSGGKGDGPDASRCALARDVLSGAVSHPNGAPTDAYDRELAENDVRVFCH